MKTVFSCLLVALLVTSWANADDEGTVEPLTTEGPPVSFGVGPHCTGPQNVAFMKCLAGVLQAHFDDLDKKGQAHVDAKIKLIQGCYTKNGCTAKIDFKKAPEDLFDDADVKALIKGIGKFLDGASREFLRCLLTDLATKIIGGLEKCIQQQAPFFEIPKPYPDLPFPAEADFTDKAKRAILKNEIQAIFSAFANLKQCPKDPKKLPEIPKCILKPLFDPIVKCTKTKICTIPACKDDLPDICKLAGACLKDKLKEGGNFLSGDNQNKVLDLMGKCEKQAQTLYKITTPQYSRTDVVKLYTLAKKVLADAKKSGQFKEYFEIFAGQFDAAKAFCANACK